VVSRLIDLALRFRGAVLGAALVLGVWGYWALGATAVDAIPDLSDPQVIVFTDWAGHSAQELEDQVTYPLTTMLEGLPGVRVVRGQSAFGFSMIYVVLNDDVDVYFARSRVLERLGLSAKSLPAGVVPTLGPDATGVGHVFWYRLEGAGHPLRDLRTIQDWFVRYQLASVPGVAEVASVGGTVQQYQIDVDPNRLRTYGVSLGDVVRAVGESNANVGGNVIEANGTWSVVRGVGLIETLRDIENILVTARNGVPIFVRQVADVRVGDAFRVASLVNGAEECVGGVVVARAGANAQDVIRGVKARLREIEPGLPPGVTVVPFYDRSALIDRTLGTLRTALLEEILLVILAHVIFLRHVRSILVVTLPLPLAVLAAFIAMHYAGVTSNLMSLAGIAIAIGVLVDAGIVVTENAFRHIERSGATDRARIIESVRDATRLVGRPVFFSMAIILLAFAPVFALTGQEGKLFHPLAFTKTAAVLAATVLAVTFVPVLCTYLLRGRLHAEDENPVMRLLRAGYQPVLAFALRRRAATLGVAALLFAGALVVFMRLGSEFMPPLNEGDLLFMPIADPSVSLAENTRIAAQQNTALLAFPEVESVVAKVARAETSTDPSPLNMTETLVHLKPHEAWPPGMTIDRLRAEMGRAVQLPGVANIWTMPIINRIDMLTTGIRSEVGVKILGSDLGVLERLAREVGDVVRTVPGAANVYPEPVTSGQYLNIRVDREAAARFGLSVAAVEDVVTYAIGETPVGMTIEGRRRVPIRVRYAEAFRRDPQAIRDTLVTTPSGGQVPLHAVASIEPARGPAMITSENGLLVATVLLNVQGRDVGGFVEDARTAVARAVPLPAGYYLTWSGRYESQNRAEARLRLIVPIVILLIFGLLAVMYRSALEAAHVLLAVPFALTGGMYLVWGLGYNLSVAVWVGFIALFGTAVQTAVVMVIYLEDAVQRKRASLGGVLTRGALREAVMEGALLRLRPKVMTVSTVVAGLLPIMWSTRAGAEVMKPLAAPVLGGMLSSLAHVLIVTPVIFCWLRERQIATAVAAEPGAPPAGDRAPRRRLSPFRVTGAAVAIVLISLTTWWVVERRQSGGSAAPGESIQSTIISGVRVDLRSLHGHLHQGRNDVVLEFRSTVTNGLVAVSGLRLTATMTMPGMATPGDIAIGAPNPPGRFPVSAEFGMAGAWRFTAVWDGPGGRQSASFDGDVR
jgi:Cu(I)/Ag(I) efflux system membrane protein CusA/SilA